MIFTETELTGAFIVDIEKREDDRGFFARSWCQEEFRSLGLNASVVQANISFNNKKGTVRGMHYQAAPYQEAKLIRCTQGSIYDVIIDLRPDSATFKNWIGVELSAENHRMLYVPDDFAHGFQTLEDNTEISYLMAEFFKPEAARGARWNDPAFNVIWPLPVKIISEKDANWPDFPVT